MKQFIKHAQSNIIRGFLVIIPLFLSLLVCRIIYVFIDKQIVNLIAKATGFRVPGLGIIFLIVFLYFLGLFVGHYLGRKLFSIVEMLLGRIPIINTTYNIGKQISEMFSLTEKEMFSRVVLVEAFRKGSYTIGFVTGTSKIDGKDMIRAFVPTVPNPTTGFFMLYDSKEVIDPGWTIEEGIKAALSGGIIFPPEIIKK